VKDAAVLVRSIVPSDEDAYRAILEDTSAEDRYCRFFHLVDHFDPDEVHRFVETRPDMVGVIAFDGDSPLGAAHAALIDDDSGELAIVVARAARRRGVGTALIDALIVRLRERGLRRLIANALRENRPLEKLAKRAGFHVEVADGPALRWVLELAPSDDSVKP
jgi:RimJ/RimL family protein N-acetyltransferase